MPPPVPVVPRPAPTLSLPLRLILLLVALLALAVPVLVVLSAPEIVPLRTRVVRPVRVVPKAELPPVEPVKFQALAPEDAKSFNATVPFSTAPNPPARPFRLFGTAQDQARAVDCLAAGVFYEAGDDPVGERAVAQVILNRVRHPAYPNSVCGVVFQGQERRTGCQFTFTCDGAMVRVPSAAAWGRARAIARAALTGSVTRAVGHATHYHTDWVVPYWSSSLDKITEVHTHLFFRWAGWWGTPPAFNRGYAGAEPIVAKLAALSTAHRTAEQALAVEAGLIDPATLGAAISVAEPASPADPNSFLVTLDRQLEPGDFMGVAQRACGERPYCKVFGWTNPKRRAQSLPLGPEQIATMSFSYLRDRENRFDKALWNCTEFPRIGAANCMRQQVLTPRALPTPRPGEIGRPAAPAPNLNVPVLGGIRRRAELAARPSPTPTPSPVPSPTPR